MSGFARLSNGAKAAFFAVGTAGIASSTVYAKEQPSYFDEELQKATSYDLESINFQKTRPLGPPDALGTPKQRFSAISGTVEPVNGLRLSYAHQAPTNTVDIHYDLLNPQNPKYGKLEASIKADSIQCTRNTSGEMTAMFEVPYLPVMIFAKDAPEGNMFVAQTGIPITPSSVMVAKLLTSQQAGNQLTCTFNQSVATGVAVGTETTIILNNNQAVYSGHISVNSQTKDGFIQTFGAEVNSRGTLTLHYIRPVYNGLLLAAEYNLDPMAGQSSCTGVARFRTDKTRTTLQYSTSGQHSASFEYTYNNHIKLIGTAGVEPNSGAPYYGATVEFNRTIAGEK